jgi:hypothetical protein
MSIPTATNHAASATPREFWLLARWDAGGPPPDLSAFTSPLALEAATAMAGANGVDPDALLNAWLTQQPPAFADAFRTGIFAADVNDPNGPPAAGGGSSLFTVHSADEALPPPPPVEFVVEPIIESGTLNCFTGSAGKGKTWMLYDLGICIACGKKWLDFPTRQGRVLIIDRESGQKRIPRRLHRLMRSHGLGAGLPLTWITMDSPPFDPRDAAHLAELERMIVDDHIEVVLMDSLICFIGDANENDSREMRKVLEPLQALVVKRDIVIIVLHHHNKENKYRGATGIQDAVDCMAELNATNKDLSRVDVASTKTRDAPAFEFAFKIHFDLNGDVGLLPLSPKPKTRAVATYSRPQQFVIAYLEKSATGTIEAMGTAAQEAGFFRPGTIKNAVWDLKKKGVIRRRNPGERKAEFELDLMAQAMAS